MAVGTALATASVAHVVKKIIDDLYGKLKESATNRLGKARAEIKDQSIARSISSVTKVKTLWNIDKEVSLYDFYYQSTIEFNKDNKKKVNSIREFGSVGHIVLQGTAGQGKSIFLRFLCGQELKPDTSSGRIPIFIELRRIAGDLSLSQLISNGLEKFKLPSSATAWDYLAESGKFVLLLDAFDEIDPVFASRTLVEIEQLVERYRDTLQILVTSRPDSDIQKSNHFRVYRLSQLSESDHAPFLRKICIDKEQANSLLKVLHASPADVSALLTTPLMMTLLVILYKSMQTIPDTVPKFYEELFDVLFYRHDHSKPGFRRKRYTQLDDGTVKKLFSALCFFVRLNGLGVLTTKQLNECCEMAEKATNINVDFNSFKLELVKTICLMQEEGFDISFIHKSVAQYYAASFVSKSADEFAGKFYELASKQTGWELELKFLSQIDSFRFNKMYELPLLRRAAAEMNISLEVSSDDDVTKVNAFFMDNVSIVAASGNVNSNVKQDPWPWLLGWTSGKRNDSPRGALAELSFHWMHPIFDHLKTTKPPFPEDIVITHDHTWIPIKILEKAIGRVSDIGSKNLLEAIHRRYAAANKIIDSEGKKADMLSAFLLQPRPHL